MKRTSNNPANSYRSNGNAIDGGVVGGEVKRPTDISSVVFNPEASDIATTWSSYASEIICVNPFQNGITLSIHKHTPLGEESESGEQPVRYAKEQFHLRMKEMRDYRLAPGKYFMYKEGYAAALEEKFSQLEKQGRLVSSVVYFGTTADPFYAFHKKFNVTMTCLNLFEQYRPGLVVLQTRSPMAIAALPMLKGLEERAVAVVPIETHLDTMVQRYTPGQPKVADRLLAVNGLRAQGISVNICVSPVLPYGDFYKSAWDFADILARNADSVTLGSLSDGSEALERQMREMPLCRRMVADKQYRWLRPHAYRALYSALRQIAPDKLVLPIKKPGKPKQLDMFAA